METFMNVSLTPELAKYVQEKLETGLYGSASEVVRAALRLHKEHDALKDERLDAFRRGITFGLDQLARGEGNAGARAYAESHPAAERRLPRREELQVGNECVR